VSLSFSRRAEGITQAEIRVMTIECEKVRGINLAQGVCDTEVPLPVRRGAQIAVDKGINSYTRYDGLAELRQAIARKMREYNGIIADPETEVTVSGGSTGAFYCACLALLDPGDEVIVFEPYYGYHVNTLEAVDAAPTYVTMHPPDWRFSREELERVVTPRTKGIMVNTPANPSGKVFTRAGCRHISPGSLPGMGDRTITISGFSKTFSITGWRVGYSVSDTRWAHMIGYMNDLVYVCAPAPLQCGVAAGINELTGAFYRELSSEYARKRDRICGALRKVGLHPSIPKGAYYVLADVSRLPGKTSKEKAMHLLARTGVASVPGSAFYHGSGGENLVRFCFAKTDAELEEACQRIVRIA